jgi:hydroxyethylthiazole kinase-like uncharacterized protein yjeF
MRVLNSQQMREADRRTIEELGIPSATLMERAGAAVVDAIDARWPRVADIPGDIRPADTSVGGPVAGPGPRPALGPAPVPGSAPDSVAGSMPGRVAVLCGRGNNGGDGFVIARIFRERRIDVVTYLIGQIDQVAGDARLMLDAARQARVEIVEVPDADAWRTQRSAALQCGLIVDAMFGTGIRVPLTGFVATVIEDVNASARPIVAVDLPSGLSADTPEVSGAAIRATLTVTFAAPKLPLVLPPGSEWAGEVVVADIGIPASVIAELDDPRMETVTHDSIRALIAPRAADSHKGTYGRILIVAGSVGKTGAAFMSAMSALRSGAGLVTVATPASCLPTIASMGAEYMTMPLDEDAEGGLASGAVEQVMAIEADVIAVGPGLGRSSSTATVIRALVERARVTTVLDADALIAFAGDPTALARRGGAAAIITPHPGEMARLVGRSTADVQSNRLDVATSFALAHRVHVVLKGHRTLVASPEGHVAINTTGNPGMATAGAGDVLTGVIAAWAARLADPADACRLAVYLHGLAGDLAEAEHGETALIAGDIIDELGHAVLAVTGHRRPKPTDALHGRGFTDAV